VALTPSPSPPPPPPPPPAPGSPVADRLATLERRGDGRPLAADVDLTRIGAYRAWVDVLAALRRLESRGARVREIGQSRRGEPLWGVELGPADAPRVSALLGGIHATEWIGVETMLALLDRLAAAPPRDRRILAVPVVNPDGYREVEADLRTGKRRFRRSNAAGVDLNRNWPTHFRVHRRIGLSGWNYGGPAPCSEPEIAAVVAALDEAAGLGGTLGSGGAGGRLDVAVSFHSFGRKLLVPWGGRWRRPAAEASLRAAAVAVQARLAEPYGIRQISRWAPGFFAYGTELDHLHARYGATALLVECSRGGLVRDPDSWLRPFRWFNPADPARVAADLAQAVEPLVRGRA
jgi:hypothetical protein